MPGLIEKLEAADEGSRELDWAVECELHGWPLDHMRHAALPNYTTSLDDALTLAPEGWYLRRLNQYHNNREPAWGWGAELRYHPNPIIGLSVGESRASAPLALCIAALRAREALEF